MLGLGFRLSLTTSDWGVWVCVWALRLYPGTPGWSVPCGCVCLGWGFGCALPLLAGVFGCVCACVPASLVPRHSWLGCAVWQCVIRLGFWLRPATPGRAVGVCVCFCAPSACTPPLLAGVCGVGACVWARVSAAPRHSWPGFWVCICLCAHPACTPPFLVGVCGVCVCMLGLGFRLRPASPGWCVGVSVCLCVHSACITQLLALVCGVGVCACARVSAAPRHSWLGCWGVCVLVCAPRLYPAIPGVCGVGVCVWARYVAAHRLSWLVCWGVCVFVRAPHVPRHSSLGCAVWVCVFGLGFRLRPATPGWVVLVCVCLCARSACTPPLLAVVCGVGLCAWDPVSAALRHSWLGCWGLFVFVCALCLYPATPGWSVRCGCVYLASGFGCALPLLAWVFVSVCACVRALLLPRHSWLGCAVLGVCVWAWAVAAPRLSWLGDWGVRVCVRAPLVPRQSWLGLAVCVCVFGLGFRLRPPLLAGVFGCSCAFLRAPLVSRHSWLGCAVWVCVLGFGFRLSLTTPGWGVGVFVCALRSYSATPGWGLRCGCVCLRPATPGWGVGACVCLCASSACTLPPLAGVCGVGL